MQGEAQRRIADILAGLGMGRSERTPEEKRQYEQRRVDWINKNPGSLTGIDCKDCLNRGYSAYMTDDGEIRMMECHCMAERRSRERIKKSGLENVVARYTFDNWQVNEPWQAEALQAAERYAEEKKGWFIAFGNVGTGKSHLCTAICSRLMADGIDVSYMLWRDVSTRAKAAVNSETYTEIVNPLKTIPALYIDDFYKTGKGQEPTTADVNLAFEILNDRYTDDKKLTIISTERSMKELLAIDEAVGSRIYERCKGHGVSFIGKENWRLKSED